MVRSARGADATDLAVGEDPLHVVAEVSHALAERLDEDVGRSHDRDDDHADEQHVLDGGLAFFVTDQVADEGVHGSLRG